jgi:two-component system chemotaxis response regulator CheY
MDLPAASDRAARRILSAEDHPQMADLVEKILTKAGHTVVSVIDGQQALELAGAEHFDVLVTDHNMPILNGLELVTALRHRGFTGKIVVHTSRLTPVEEAEYRALRIDGLLMKPAGILQLPKLVQ